MKRFVLVASMILVACASHAAVLFREDWNQGKIDESEWLAATEPNGSIQLIEVAKGDMALLIHDTQGPGNGLSIANVSLNSKKIFPRGANLRVSYRIWWQPDRPNAGAPPGSISAPWFLSSYRLASYFNNEAVLGLSGKPTLDENRTRGHVTLTDAESLEKAWASATSHEAALTLRVSLGDETGAALAWRDAAGWHESLETRGRKADGDPYAPSPSVRKDDFGNPLSAGLNISHAPWARLGFQPWEGWIVIDDIVVENDQTEEAAREAMAKMVAEEARATAPE